MTPHERLAIGKQTLPRARNAVASENAQAVLVAIGRPQGSLTTRALDQPRRKPSRRKRPGRRNADPFARELTPRCEGQRQGAVLHPHPNRQLYHEGDSSTHRWATEPPSPRESHSPGDGYERLCVRHQEASEHAT